MTIRLGSKVKDKVTGCEGIVVAETRWMTGCLRYTVAPPVDKDGKRREYESFDEFTLEVLATPEETGVHALDDLPVNKAPAAAEPAPRAPGGPQPSVSQY